MTNSPWTKNLKRLRAGVVLGLLPLFAGCVKGGSLTSDGSSTGGAAAGSVTVQKVYPTSAGDSWSPIIDTSPLKYYVKGTSLTITGTCSRGVSTVKAHEASAANYAEVSTCDANGYFSFTHVYAASTDVDKDLTLVPYDISDVAMTGSPTTVTVHMDDGIPASPVITTPAGAGTYAYNGSSNIFRIHGTCAADVVKLTYGTPTGPEITPSGINWQFDVTLTPGVPNMESFYAYDKAGNYSVITTKQIDWAPQVTLRAFALGAGGVKIQANGTNGTTIPGASIDAVIDAFSGTAALSAPVPGLSAPNNHVSLGLGFNFITNNVRNQP